MKDLLNVKKKAISALLSGIDELEHIESAVMLSKKSIDRSEINRNINTGIDLASHYANKDVYNIVDLAVVAGYQNLCINLISQLRKENREIIPA